MGPELSGAGRATLTARGAARRDAMLHELDAAMRRRNVRRAALRIAARAAPLVLIGALIWGRMAASPSIPSRGNPGGTIEAREAAGPNSLAPLVQIVQTDRGIVGRYSLEHAESRVQVISDSELQSLLATIGKPTGLVRVGAKVILATDLTRRSLGESLESKDPGASS